MSDLVGIALCDCGPASLVELDIQDKHCRFIGRARKKAFYIPSGNISCPLARFYLGIGRTNLEDLCRTLVRWDDAIDKATARAYLDAGLYLDHSPPFICYFPYPTGELEPDVLIMIDDPAGVQSMVREYCAQTGRRIKASVSGIGAACGECTAYPLLTGEANVSVGCNGSRPGINLRKDELLLAMPFNSEIADIAIRGIKRRDS